MVKSQIRIRSFRFSKGRMLCNFEKLQHPLWLHSIHHNAAQSRSTRAIRRGSELSRFSKMPMTLIRTHCLPVASEYARLRSAFTLPIGNLTVRVSWFSFFFQKVPHRVLSSNRQAQVARWRGFYIHDSHRTTLFLRKIATIIAQS